MEKTALYYEVHGEQGPFLLLVHGMLSSRAQWIHNLDALKNFCRPVIIELFGHGRSSSPENPRDYTPENYVLEFEKIRKELDVKKWFICGQSLGASLTLRYALDHPEHIAGQIFTNSHSGLSDVRSDRDPDMLIRRIKEQGRKVIDEFPFHPSKGRNLPEEIRKALLDDVKKVTIEGFRDTSLYTITKSGILPLLPATRVPTLLIAGRFEKSFVPLIRVAEKTIPGLELLLLDGGHAVNIHDADGFNQAAKRFIKGFPKEDLL
ncbi:MAG: alpha/beta hydrolase [Deltaproteobacteria bacterium]|nr:alpha/beta hydrolase [Deltaproteobacteria bacterium]